MDFAGFFICLFHGFFFVLGFVFLLLLLLWAFLCVCVFGVFCLFLWVFFLFPEKIHCLDMDAWVVNIFTSGMVI